MKFAALVLLLAVGSQAASLQADAPDHLSQGREKLKDAAKRILAPLDDTPYKERKNNALEMVDARLAQAIEMAQSAYNSAHEATAGVRETITTDIQKMQADLNDQAEKARATILAHVQEYIAALTPLKTHLESKRADIEEMREKVRSAVDAISEKVPGNWDETRGTLFPIYNRVRDQIVLRGNEGKEIIMPYVNDYLELGHGALQDPSKLTGLEDVKAKLSAYVSAFLESLNKN